METSTTAGTVPWKNVPLCGKKAMGRSFIVDIDDYKKMLGRKWYVSSKGIVISANGKNSHGGITVIAASHVILGDVRKSASIKYIDGDKFNLRKSNLRVVGVHPIKTPSGMSYHGINQHPSGKSKKYAIRVGTKYCGSTNDLEEAALMVDVCRVRKMGWDAAVKSGQLNCPDMRVEIMEALRNGDDIRFLYGSKKKNPSSDYSYVRPSGRGFRGAFQVGDKRFSTNTLLTAKDAAFALYDLAVKKLGKRKASRYEPLDLILEKGKIVKTKPEVQESYIPKSETPKLPLPKVDNLGLTEEQKRMVDEAMAEMRKIMENVHFGPLNAGPGTYILRNDVEYNLCKDILVAAGYYTRRLPISVIEAKIPEA
jgi:hypothetical protein